MFDHCCKRHKTLGKRHSTAKSQKFFDAFLNQFFLCAIAVTAPTETFVMMIRTKKFLLMIQTKMFVMMIQTKMFFMTIRTKMFVMTIPTKTIVGPN
jgi:hypothetical protein